jgi:thiol-disulfide isomerase/thioredoxin
MNNKIIIVGGVLLVFVIGVLFLKNQNPKQTEQVKMVHEEVEKKNPVMEKTSDSHYLTYSKEVYDQTSGKRRVLFFYANWCPTCKIANEDFTANQNKIPEDVVVIRTNYNDTDTDQDEKDLARKYGITYQHTFVQIDSTGKEVIRWNGGQTDELLIKIK